VFRAPRIRFTAILLLVANCLLLAPGVALSATDLENAEQLYRQQGPEAALAEFETLEKRYREFDDAQNLGRAIRFVGEIHWRLGDYPQAAERLEEALALARASHDRLLEGKVLNVLGLLNWDLGAFEEAREFFRQGSEIADAMGDKRLAGAILNNLSLVDDEQGDYLTSLSQYQRVLEYYEAADFPRGRGDTLGNIGGVKLLLGRYAEALDYYRQALAVSESLDSTIAKSQDHGNIGLSLLGLGRVDEAMDQLQQAISLADGAGMEQDRAFWLRASGNANLRFGRYDLGLQQFQAALEIYERIGSGTERVEALNDMGSLHQSLGDPAGAESYYQQAMDLARDIGLARGVTLNQVALGDVQRYQGNTERASALYGEAAQRAAESGEMSLWISALLRQSQLDLTMQHTGSASELAIQAQSLATETGSPVLLAQALVTLADAKRQDPAQINAALAGYTRALEILDKSPDADLAWRAHYGKGLALDAAGQRGEAISALYAAIEIIENVRDQLLQDRFRAGYIQDKYQVYVDLVRLQLEAGQNEEAFNTAERLRSRSYRELLDHVTPPKLETADTLQEYQLRERIETLRKALVEEQRLERPLQRQAAIGVYSGELLAAEQAYQDFLDDRRQTRRGGPGQAAPTYAEVAALLEDDEALLEYVVGEDNLVVFALTRKHLTARSIPLRRVDLQSKVELLRDLVHRPDDRRWEKPAGSIADKLLAPVLGVSQFEDIQHIYIVAHGVLNYLPFALLPAGSDGSHRMVDLYTLDYLPTSAALAGPAQTANAQPSVLALAPGRSRLKYSAREVRAVDALFAPQSRALIGKSATETAFKQEASKFRVLHLATHGFFNKFNPLLSGLELEPDADNNGELELYEIFGLQLQADLVTLSACRTALGSGHYAEIPSGDDFVSLTRAFLYAGSKSVLATLWEVDDASTAEFMKDFYAGLKNATARRSRSQALADAQRALIAGGKYSHPFYWAPFVLVGDTARSSITQS